MTRTTTAARRWRALRRVGPGLAPALFVTLALALGPARAQAPAAAPAPAPAAAPLLLNPLIHRGEVWAMRGFSMRVPACCLFASSSFSFDETVLTGLRETPGQRARSFFWIMSVQRQADDELSDEKLRAYLLRAHVTKSLPEALSIQINPAPARPDGARCHDYRLLHGPAADADPARAAERSTTVGTVCRHPGAPGLAIEVASAEIGAGESTTEWQQAVREALATLRFTPLDSSTLLAADEAFKKGDADAGRAGLERVVKDIPLAAYLLGRRLLLGDGMTADPAAALPHLQSAADSGIRDAKFLLGQMYLRGLGATRNTLAGMQWLEKAADMRHNGAQLELALLARQPQGYGLADDDRACRLAEYSSRNGNTRATKLLDEWSCKRRLPQ